MKLKFFVLTICLVVLATSGVDAGTQNLQLLLNELKVFPVYRITRVAVGDPAIADVTVLSERELLLMAKKAGTTSLIIWDEPGQRSFTITVIEMDLERIAQRIEALFVSANIHGVRLKTEEDNVYVIGEVLTQRELDKIGDVLAPFANVVNLVNLRERQPLIEIDVNVSEVAFDDLKKLGLDWSTALPIQYSEPTVDVEGKMPKLWRVFRWDRSTVTAKLNFLIEEGKARTLANPKLVTLSGEEASFLVGGEVPYVTLAGGAGATTKVEWKEYGIALKILPFVNAKNEIRTRIKAEVSDLDWGNAVLQEGFRIPGLTKREVRTELFLNEGDSVFLAGLIKGEDSHRVAKLPWLSKVPILGELFKSTDFRDKRTELVISITPGIIGEKASPGYISQEMLKQEAVLSARKGFSEYSEEKGSPLAYYTRMIGDIIASNIVYPKSAGDTQQEGVVKIDLELLSNGQLKEVRIKESSGSHILDRAALSAVREQAPYPPFPSKLAQNELRLTVPVVFKSYVRN